MPFVRAKQVQTNDGGKMLQNVKRVRAILGL